MAEIATKKSAILTYIVRIYFSNTQKMISIFIHSEFFKREFIKDLLGNVLYTF